MTEYSVPTFLKEVKDLLKFPELRFLNRFDWIPVSPCLVLLRIGFFSWFQNYTGLNGVTTLIWGFLVPTIFLYHGTFAVNSFAHLLEANDTKLTTKAETTCGSPFSPLEKDGTIITIFTPSQPDKDFSLGKSISPTLPFEASFVFGTCSRSSSGAGMG